MGEDLNDGAILSAVRGVVVTGLAGVKCKHPRPASCTTAYASKLSASRFMSANMRPALHKFSAHGFQRGWEHLA